MFVTGVVALDPEIVDRYRAEGVVVLRDVVSPDEIRLLRAGIDAVIDSPSPRAKIASPGDDPGLFLEDFCTWRDRPEFTAFLQSTRLAAVAAELMGSSRVHLYHDHVLVKEPHTRQRTRPGSRKVPLPIFPTSTRVATIFRFVRGVSSPVMSLPSTCSPCTEPRAWPAEDSGGCSACASSGTTWSTHHASRCVLRTFAP